MRSEHPRPLSARTGTTSADDLALGFYLPLLPLQDTALQASVIQDVAQVAPAAQLVVLPNCSHWVQQDQPEKVNQLMRDFLAQPAAKA